MLAQLLSKPVALLAGAVLAFAAGFALQGELKDGEIARIHLAHAQALAQAEQAKSDADERARLAEQATQKSIDTLATDFTERQAHEKVATDQRIADLLSERSRLRIAINRSASGSALSCPASPASGGDGEATATLDGRAAARLTARYAEYNELVDQIDLLQATIDAYRKQAPTE